MNRQSDNNDNRFYAYLPSSSTTSSRHSSSNSTNQNAHYQYYDPRLRSRQHTQQNLYDLQHSFISPNRSPGGQFSSFNNQLSYQPPTFRQEPLSISNTVSDLGEPISIFDDIKPIEQRRSIVASRVPTTYVPPDPTQRLATTDTRIATAQMIREQLLQDIQSSINDIDRELTTLERRPSMPRYLPPRFSPIVELDHQDDNFLRQTTKAIKPYSVPTRPPVPIVTSPTMKPSHQTSAHSSMKERHSGASQMWPNKPKRVYEVIPSLAGDSRRTSRQSSVVAQQEHVRITEIRSFESTPKQMETRIPSNIQFRGQYHYPPEVDEVEILPNDPENADLKSTLEELAMENLYKTLTTEQFLRNLSPTPKNRAVVFVPEYSGSNQTDNPDSVANIIPDKKIPTNMFESVVVNPVENLIPDKGMDSQDVEPLTQIPLNFTAEPENESQRTITPDVAVPETEREIENSANPLVSETYQYPHPPTKHSRTTPIGGDDVNENMSPMQTSRHSSAVVDTFVAPTPPTPRIPASPVPRTPLIPTTSRTVSSPVPRNPLASPAPRTPLAPLVSQTYMVSPVPRTPLLPPVSQTYVAPPVPRTPLAPSVSQAPPASHVPVVPSVPRYPSSSATPTAPTAVSIPRTPPVPAIVDSIDISSPTPTPSRPPTETNGPGRNAYFFSDFGHEEDGEDDVMTIDQSNFLVPLGADPTADDNVSNSLLTQSQTPSLILQSERVPYQQQQQQQQEQQQQQQEQPHQRRLLSATAPTIKNGNENIKIEENEEIESEETDATQKRITAATPVLPLSSSPPLREVLPTSFIDDMQTQFIRNNSTNNNDDQRQPSSKLLHTYAADFNMEEQEKHLNNSQSRSQSRVRSASPMNSRIQSGASMKNNEYTGKFNDDYDRITPITHNPVRDIENERMQTSERVESGNQRYESSSRALSRRQSTASYHSKNNDEYQISNPVADSKTPTRDFYRQESNSSQNMYRRPSTVSREQSRIIQRRTSTSSASLRPASSNHNADTSINREVNASILSHETMDQTPTNDNEPNAFSVESVHFLHRDPKGSFDMNRRLPSGYSIPRSNQSPRTPTPGSELPVTLGSPDNGDNQLPTSRTVTPKKKHSIASIDLPPDPNIIFTTSDDPDPDDPSVVHSTIHFQMRSSHPSNIEVPPTQNNAPSPLETIAPIQQYTMDNESIQLPSTLSPTDEHQRATDVMALPTTQESRMQTPDTDTGLPSPSPSNLEREQSVRESPPMSPEKSERLSQTSHPSPLVPYPARLDELTRPTSSPYISSNEHRQRDTDDNSQGPFISTPVDQTIPTNNDHHHHHQFYQSLPEKPEIDNDMQLPSNSPRHSVLSDVNHTSIEGDDNYRQLLESPQDEQVVSADRNYTNDQNDLPQSNIRPSPTRRTLVNISQRRPSSEKSMSPAHDELELRHDEHLYRNDVPISSASIKFPKSLSGHSSSTDIRQTPTEDETFPTMTQSQQHSKLSLRVKHQKSQRKSSTPDQRPPSSSPSPRYHTTDNISTNDEDHVIKKKPKRTRRVSFSTSVAHFQMEERRLLTNWRERVATILARKHRPNQKYAHVQSRVNSFANFEYQPKKIKASSMRSLPTAPATAPHTKTNEQTTFEESKFLKRKKFKPKKPKRRSAPRDEEHTDEEVVAPQPTKNQAPQLFGRLWCLPDGSPTVFHESLDWKVPSKLRSYSFENLSYEPHRNEFKIFNKKPKWHSESKLADLLKEPAKFLQRQTYVPANSLPIIPDRGEPIYYDLPDTERKIFDIQNNNQYGSRDDLSHVSRGSRAYDIFNERLVWIAESKIKSTTWENIKYQPKQSRVQIYNKAVHWNNKPKLRTRPRSTINPTQTSMSQVQIFDQKLNWDAQAKVHCWSEVDLRQLTKKKAIFAQYHDPKWNDVVTPRVEATNYNYPRHGHHVEIFSDRPAWTRNSELRDYIWENFDYKSQPRTRQSTTRPKQHDIDQSPANRPKWNAVSSTNSVNNVYNPAPSNSTTVRRGWDQELRRKRVHRLPPLKRKRKHTDVPQLAIDSLPPSLPSNAQLAIDYNLDHSSITQGRTTSNGYATASSRRSSRALVPINHHRFVSELELPTETPRSQRPVQQEWYEEMSKSRLTHRTDMGRSTNHSFRNSVDSIQPTPRELATFRSSTRNSQISVMSGTLLDPTIRSNRATELRLSKDMEEYHQHSHTPSQSMPIEIRGFQLEGTQLSVSDNATIRPLSNVNYGTSERVKSRRVYPWSSLHPHGTSSRNSSLVPIAEFRRPSAETTITEAQQLIHEE